MKIDDILKECKRQARIETADYCGDRSAYAADCYARNVGRKKVQTHYGFMKYYDFVGTYGRVTITSNNIDFTPCQYAPTEIYEAVYWCLRNILQRDYEASMVDGVATN